MSDVWIPDNPAERTYACPGCHRGVVAKRVGDSSSYVITHLDEKVGKGEEGEGKCKYKGAIDRKLLGYRPPKEKKDEPDSATQVGHSEEHSAGTGIPAIDGTGS